MILINVFCAWMIVLCSFTFLKIVFEKELMTRFHFIERMSMRFGILFICIAESIIGYENMEPTLQELLLNIGICIVSMFLNYNYYNKKKW